jgi:hypothetical protein
MVWMVVVFFVCWYSLFVGILCVLVFCVCWYSLCVGILCVLVFFVCWYSLCVGIFCVLVFLVLVVWLFWLVVLLFGNGVVGGDVVDAVLWILVLWNVV